MQIRRIILYNFRGETRELRFSLGRVNVLSGPSERGKSAVLAIIDYCLGASKLGVPAGHIEDAVAWYALELDFQGEQIFVARPGASTDKDDASRLHISFGSIEEPPPLAKLDATLTKEEFAAKISSKLGIGVIALTRQDGRIERRRLTFRSGLIYCLQKQNEIANPDLFFHRQGDSGIAQQVRDTLPYYLGAISEDIISLQGEIKSKRKRLKEIQKKLDRQDDNSTRRDEEAAYLLKEAQKTGLIPEDTDEPELPDDMMALLRQAEAASLNPIERPGENVFASLGQQLSTLQNHRSDIQRELDALAAFINDQDLVQNNVQEQKRRLRTLHLIPEASGAAETCPVCNSRMIAPSPTVQDLTRSLKALEQELTFISQDRSEVTEAIAIRKTQLDETESEIASVRRQIARLREADQRTRALLEQRNEMARVGGMLQMFLRVNDAPAGGARSALEAEAAALMLAIEDLEEETDFTGLKTRTATFLGGIGQNITTWARQQGLGYTSGLVTLDIRGPGLVCEVDTGGIPFSRFGSGKNWVWYHILGHMALHQWFIEKSRPTPRFLVLDQPSQVYFPAGHPREGQQDLEEVRKIYHWLFETAESFGGKLQIIVTDHARFPEDPRFTEHLEHDWWDNDEALIPKEWLS
jgi:peptidoglycan hydrolase CwlO-like protein